MSAVPADGIVGVSARYAAQIRDLLFAQAVRRAAAEEEAARAQAEADRAARIEAARAKIVEEPVKVEVSALPEREIAEPIRQPDSKFEPQTPAPATLFDVQA